MPFIIRPEPKKRLKNNTFKVRRIIIMANRSNKTVVPQARAALDKFKMEAANEVGVNLNNSYNGDITARQAGSVGGQMVKKMIEKYENDLKNGNR